MSLISILIVLVVFGVVLYLVGLVPMNETVRKAIYAVAVLFLVLWLLQALGVLGGSLGAVRLR